MRHLGLLFALALPCAPVPAADTVVVVVRHAEKGNDDPRDPTLAPAGVERAHALARLLAGTDLAAAYATQYRRTRLSAEPSAAQAKLAVQALPINASNAANYAADLRRRILAKHAGRTVLIVGHSNTVPEIVEVLSGQASTDMPETEFDRLTTVILSDDGRARVLVSRY